MPLLKLTRVHERKRIFDRPNNTFSRLKCPISSLKRTVFARRKPDLARSHGGHLRTDLVVISPAISTGISRVQTARIGKPGILRRVRLSSKLRDPRIPRILPFHSWRKCEYWDALCSSAIEIPQARLNCSEGPSGSNSGQRLSRTVRPGRPAARCLPRLCYRADGAAAVPVASAFGCGWTFAGTDSQSARRVVPSCASPLGIRVASAIGAPK